MRDKNIKTLLATAKAVCDDADFDEHTNVCMVGNYFLQDLHEAVEAFEDQSECPECLGFGGEALNDGKIWVPCFRCSGPDPHQQE